MAHRIALSAALVLSLACATARHRTLYPPARESRAGVRAERSSGPAFASGPFGRQTGVASASAQAKVAVETAVALVGRREVVLDGVDYGPGCAALVRAAFDRAGRPLPSGVRDAAMLKTLARMRGALKSGLRPAPGDLLFLADRPGGPTAHVGLVARVDPDGTAIVIHRLARGIVRVRVNLGYPGETHDPATGRRVNDLLATGASPFPAGSLVVGFADLLAAPSGVAQAETRAEEVPP